MPNVRTNYDSNMKGALAYLKRVRDKRGEGDPSEMVRRNWLQNEQIRKDRDEWTPDVAENWWRGFPAFHDEIVQDKIDTRGPVTKVSDMLFGVFGIGGQQ